MRQAGVLMHISSLPGPEGIGTLGKDARRFLRFLKDAGMALWQVLPISPTGYGESPYQCFSSFAGNPLFIDLEILEEEGLYQPAEKSEVPPAEKVDYAATMKAKEEALRLCFQQSQEKLKDEVEAFLAEQGHWLKDYALFYALKKHFGGGSWMDWPDEQIRMRQPEAMAKYRELLKEDIAYQAFVQYLFFKQWRALKKDANALGIRLFGDMPIYVAMDSADCWANPEIFLLDHERRPLWVAGVPPDYFTMDGQLWGNPLYDWKRLRKDRYRWWIQRLRAMGEIYDLIRVDHFIGFANYYAVRYGASTARYGGWRVGPGRHFFKRVRKELPDLHIIAEDLGAINDRVRKLLNFCGYPGMKVLSFAFSGGDDNIHLPEHCLKHSVYYTGTHDNDTVLGWWEKAGEAERARAREVLQLKDDSKICQAMVEEVLKSRADTAILPMQDLLCLPGSARMNLPGTLGGNWLWRMLPDALNDQLSQRLKAFIDQTERSPYANQP